MGEQHATFFTFSKQLSHAVELFISQTGLSTDTEFLHSEQMQSCDFFLEFNLVRFIGAFKIIKFGFIQRFSSSFVC